MNDSNNQDISNWTQSGSVERCGYFPARDDMGSKFWGKIKSDISGRTKYLLVNCYRAVADTASQSIKEGDRVMFSGKQGATKGKDGDWSICLDFNSFAVLAEDRLFDPEDVGQHEASAKEDEGMDDVPMF
jgi:hypothetical protein